MASESRQESTQDFQANNMTPDPGAPHGGDLTSKIGPPVFVKLSPIYD